MNDKWKKILKIMLIAAIIPVAFVLVVLIRAFSILESGEEIMHYKNATAAVVLSQEGEIIGKIFTENRTNVSYDQIPAHLLNALVATEDVRFYEHKGVDTKSLFRVFFKTLLLNNESSGGGSTITQQLAKNMFGRIRSGPFPMLVNKAKEAILARRIEKLFTKTEILTLYLNTIPFGENVFGIEAASLRYFNKKVEQLDIEESAVLIGMLKANHLYNPRLHPDKAKERRNVVLALMQKHDYLGADEADSLSRLPVKVDYVNLESGGPADYFVYQVRNEAQQILDEIQASGGKVWNIEEDGLIIKTTLNLNLQRSANEAFREHLSRMQKRLSAQYQNGSGKRYLNYLVKLELQENQLTESANEAGIRPIFDWNGTFSDSITIADSIRHNLQLLHSGLIAMDPKTGAIKAWAGGIDYKTQPYDQVLARRQMGSTLKPILYAAAFEEGVSPCKYLNNDSITLEGYEEWRPSNFDNTYGGKYSLTGALVHSMNIPTLNLFLEVGFGRLDTLWKRMGFYFNLDNTPSLAMGTAEASILELAVAYSAFSNGGFRISPQKILSIEAPDGIVIWKNSFRQPKFRVLATRTCQLMNAILQKAVREGTGSALNSTYGVTLPMAGKTGTSQDYTDAWFAAYNPSLVMVSRAGASMPSVRFYSEKYGTGSALALPLVALTLKGIQGDNRTAGQFNSYFPPLEPDLADELACPDFKEKDILDDFLDFFTTEEISYDSLSDKPARRKRSFFKRIFGSREKD